MAAYSKLELYELWRDNFRWQHDEIRILQDFALCDKATAKGLVTDFEATYSAQLLDCVNRAKER